MKKRIWELDALRGICILGMVAVHFVYDVVELYGLADWDLPELFLFVQKWGGVLFLLISGICVTLGRRSVRRGAIVFACGMICTAVTGGLSRLGFAGKGIVIWFGVLHCLGVCMLLWPVFKKLPWWALLAAAAVLIGLGFFFSADPIVETKLLMPLGLYWKGFASSDYFPLCPNLGFFLLGAVLGRTLYRKQETLLPKVNEKAAVLRFLSACGRHSLWIYLLHQPILSGIFYVLMILK